MTDNIIIGKGTNINGHNHFASSKEAKIIIGKYCAIANGCKIITLNHDYNYSQFNFKFYNTYLHNNIQVK